MTTRRRKRTSQPRSKLVYDKSKWVVTSTEIKNLRESIKPEVCPVTNEMFEGTGMKQAVLDHDHDAGNVRGVLSAAANLWEGRCFKYFKKLFRDKTNEEYAEMLINLGEYLKLEPQDVLHGTIVDVERRRVTRWRNETLYKHLVMKGIDMEDVSVYTKPQLVDIYLQAFINEMENKL